MKGDSKKEPNKGRLCLLLCSRSCCRSSSFFSLHFSKGNPVCVRECEAVLFRGGLGSDRIELTSNHSWLLAAVLYCSPLKTSRVLLFLWYRAHSGWAALG